MRTHTDKGKKGNHATNGSLTRMCSRKRRGREEEEEEEER